MKLLSVRLGALLTSGFVFGMATMAFDAVPSLRSGKATTTDNAFVHADITPMSPRVTGYIVDAPIRDNQAVRKGDVLFRIDDREYRRHVDQAHAAVAARQAALDVRSDELARQRAVIAQASAAVIGARAESHRADLDVSRVRNLASQGAESQEALERAEADHIRNQATATGSHATLEAARRQLAVLESQRAQLIADIDSARAALALAELDLENTVVRALVDGWVGERQARVGQYVRPGTLLVAVVARDRWVVANFKETQMPHLSIGSEVDVAVDGVPSTRFTGRIESMSPASGARFALLPPDNATGNFTRIVQRIPVKIVLDPGQTRTRELRAGMSAEVTVYHRVMARRRMD